MTGIYIHIPFCKSRCIYCDFTSSTLGKEWQMRYVQALAAEMTQRKDEAKGMSIRSLYIGGGTPSQLTPEAFTLLMNAVQENFVLDKQAECTLEANPDDVNTEFIERLKQSPINRVSMGVQTLDDDILSLLHRRHTANQALSAVEQLQDAGYANLSLDLIYGLPRQTTDMFRNDVDRLLATDIPHLSAYALQFEEGTALWQMLQKGEVQEMNEEDSLQCYLSLMDLTAASGMEHYEISNFARPGFRSRHNSSYWQGLPYLGFGAGAHSFDGKRIRRWNTSDIKAYLSGSTHAEEERLSETDRYNERIMLSLRTCEGLSLTALEQDFGENERIYCEQQAQKHLRQGTLRKTGEALCLTRSGLFISDTIISDLFHS